jgi:hypothetical protein
MAEEALDARAAMTVLSNAALAAARTKWNVLTAMVLEQKRMVASALDALEQERIRAMSAAARIYNVKTVEVKEGSNAMIAKEMEMFLVRNVNKIYGSTKLFINIKIKNPLIEWVFFYSPISSSLLALF